MVLKNTGEPSHEGLGRALIVAAGNTIRIDVLNTDVHPANVMLNVILYVPEAVGVILWFGALVNVPAYGPE